jgi:5'-nucleotidase
LNGPKKPGTSIRAAFFTQFQIAVLTLRHTITYPDLPGCVSEGKSLANALHMAERLLVQWVGYLADTKQAVPAASAVHDVKIAKGEFVNLIRAYCKTLYQKDWRKTHNDSCVLKKIGIPMRILLTNDDGIQAAGLAAIHEALLEAGHNVHVVAPMTEQSAVGHALTVFLPLRVKEFRKDGLFGHGVYGTPTDCVKLALTRLVPERPELVVSGINAGHNVGPDIVYSGTVAAAAEAAQVGLPALALSMDDYRLTDARDQARHAAGLVGRIDWKSLPARRVVNVNYPDLPIARTKGLRVCPQSKAVWKDRFDERKDPRGNFYWWLHGEIPPETVDAGSDRDLLTQGYITLTPLRFDFTDRESLDFFAGLAE